MVDVRWKARRRYAVLTLVPLLLAGCGPADELANELATQTGQLPQNPTDNDAVPDTTDVVPTEQLTGASPDTTQSSGIDVVVTIKPVIAAGKGTTNTEESAEPALGAASDTPDTSSDADEPDSDTAAGGDDASTTDGVEQGAEQPSDTTDPQQTDTETSSGDDEPELPATKDPQDTGSEEEPELPATRDPQDTGSEEEPELPATKDPQDTGSEEEPELPVTRDPQDTGSEEEPELPATRDPQDTGSEEEPELPATRDPQDTGSEEEPELPATKDPQDTGSEEEPELPVTRDPQDTGSEEEPELPATRDPQDTGSEEEPELPATRDPQDTGSEQNENTTDETASENGSNETPDPDGASDDSGIDESGDSEVNTDTGGTDSVDEASDTGGADDGGTNDDSGSEEPAETDETDETGDGTTDAGSDTGSDELDEESASDGGGTDTGGSDGETSEEDTNTATEPGDGGNGDGGAAEEPETPVEPPEQPVSSPVFDGDMAYNERLGTVQCVDVTDTSQGFGQVDSSDWRRWFGNYIYSQLPEYLATGQDGERAYIRQKLIPTSYGSHHVQAGNHLAANRTYRLTQSLYFEPGFDWGGRNEGGKVGYGLGGGSAPSGGKLQTDGFTLRLMWRGNRNGTARLVAYSYAADRSQHLPYGDDHPFQDFLIPVGQWFDVTMEVKTNSSTGARDGSLRAWVDGVLRLDMDNIGWQTSGSQPAIQKMSFTTFYGGNDSSWAPSHTTYIRYADACWAPVLDANQFNDPVQSEDQQIVLLEDAITTSRGRLIQSMADLEILLPTLSVESNRLLFDTLDSLNQSLADSAWVDNDTIHEGTETLAKLTNAIQSLEMVAYDPVVASRVRDISAESAHQIAHSAYLIVYGAHLDAIDRFRESGCTVFAASAPCRRARHQLQQSDRFLEESRAETLSASEQVERVQAADLSIRSSGM